ILSCVRMRTSGCVDANASHHGIVNQREKLSPGKTPGGIIRMTSGNHSTGVLLPELLGPEGKLSPGKSSAGT
ncbi:MAG: hypothetical protein J6T50_10980, partial [Lachnospiraceae bacterium]|nr:hypothetical protein [Lachnospiraceae bacterium]